MEKPKSYYLDPPPLPPEDLEPATSGSQNKNEINTMNQMNQMMMHGRGNFNPFLLWWEKPDKSKVWGEKSPNVTADNFLDKELYKD